MGTDRTVGRATSPPIIAVPCRVVALLIALAVLAACGSGERPAPASTPTVRAESTAAPGPVAARSTHYRYALTLPAGSGFQPADQPWDGRSAVTRDRPILDRVRVGPELFIVGSVWPGDLDSFAQMFVDLQAGAFGCSQAKDRRRTTVAATPAVAFIQDSCGGGEQFARVVMVHGGFGLIAFTSAYPGAIDRLMADLASLEWK